jgi:hypothetical protein
MVVVEGIVVTDLLKVVGSLVVVEFVASGTDNLDWLTGDGINSGLSAGRNQPHHTGNCRLIRSR